MKHILYKNQFYVKILEHFDVNAYILKQILSVCSTYNIQGVSKTIYICQMVITL